MLVPMNCPLYDEYQEVRGSQQRARCINHVMSDAHLPAAGRSFAADVHTNHCASHTDKRFPAANHGSAGYRYCLPTANHYPAG